MEKLVLIDGNSLINRAFYAMPPLSNKDGVITNAVYGFLNMFIKLNFELKPTHVAVAFDVKAPTFRHEMFSDYKGTRKPMPDELRPQIPLLKQVLCEMNVCCIEQAGIEADDIIGTLAKKCNAQTYIFTGDKDSFQLVDEKISVCFTKRGISDLEILSIDNFKEKVGLNPSQIIDYKALRGDTSDNIPGVKGIGEKTATDLLQKYSTLDNLYANIDEVKGSVKDKLLENKDTAYLSYRLATINTNCDVATDLDCMRFTFPFPASVKEIFRKLELKSLLNKPELFADDGEETIPTQTEKQTLPTPTLVRAESLDLLTNLYNKDVSVAVMPQAVSVYDGDTEYLFPLSQTLLDDGFTLSEVLTAISKLIQQAKSILVYDKKELRHLLKSIDFVDNFKADDLSILKYLVDFSGRSQTLTELLNDYGENLSMPAFAISKIFDDLQLKLKSDNIESLYFDIELPLSDVLFDMEVEGFKVDANALVSLGAEFNKTLDLLSNKICTLADEPNLNINSTKQLGVVLFEKLKIGKGKKNKIGYNTSSEVLTKFEDAHEIVPLILEYRKIKKLCSTYIDGFKPLIDVNTGLVHTSFNQTTTATGRLSSKEPNLQNIPVRTAEGKELRKFFAARSDDRILISADYSQIELRLLAAFSDCKPLIDAFNRGDDIHSITASRVFSVSLDSVTEEMRRNAKAVNFGIIYGISEYGLAKNVNTTPFKAREYINSYFAEYPEVKAYMEKNVEQAKTQGYSTTMLGRKRVINELFSDNGALRAFGERAAMNMPLQGSAADVIKLAMLKVYNRLKKENLRSTLILQVHDELIIDAYLDEAEKIQALLIEEMESAVDLCVKLTVSVGKGRTWYEAK